MDTDEIQRLAVAETQITTHVELCAERYGAIERRLEGLDDLIQTVVGRLLLIGLTIIGSLLALCGKLAHLY